MLKSVETPVRQQAVGFICKLHILSKMWAMHNCTHKRCISHTTKKRLPLSFSYLTTGNLIEHSCPFPSRFASTYKPEKRAAIYTCKTATSMSVDDVLQVTRQHKCNSWVSGLIKLHTHTQRQFLRGKKIPFSWHSWRRLSHQCLADIRLNQHA